MVKHRGANTCELITTTSPMLPIYQFIIPVIYLFMYGGGHTKFFHSYLGFAGRLVIRDSLAVYTVHCRSAVLYTVPFEGYSTLQYNTVSSCELTRRSSGAVLYETREKDIFGGTGRNGKYEILLGNGMAVTVWRGKAERFVGIGDFTLRQGGVERASGSGWGDFSARGRVQACWRGGWSEREVANG